MRRLLWLWKELGRDHADEFDLELKAAVEGAIIGYLWLLALVVDAAVLAAAVRP